MPVVSPAYPEGDEGRHDCRPGELKLAPRLTGVAALALSIPLVAQRSGAPAKPRLAFMDENAIAYVRPGVKVKVVSASIAKDRGITARATLTAPKDVPLDCLTSNPSQTQAGMDSGGVYTKNAEGDYTYIQDQGARGFRPERDAFHRRPGHPRS